MRSRNAADANSVLMKLRCSGWSVTNGITWPGTPEGILMGTKYQRQQILQSNDASATVVHAILRTQYGEEVYDWDPVTVAMEVQADFGCDMSATAMDRWCAMQVVMTSDAFFTRLDAFMNICNTLAEGEPAFSVFNPVTVEEMAWAISEVALNRELLPFSYAVKQYIKRCLAEDGYDEGTYPSVFAEVFDKRPAAEDVRAIMRATHGAQDAQDTNITNIEVYIGEELADMTAQFHKIQDMKTLDEIITARGLEEAIRGRGAV